MLTSADLIPVEAPALHRETARDPQGYLYDVETGEVLGHPDVSEAWRAETPEQVDWALDRRARIEADLLAIRARKKALLENMTLQERAVERRLAWWDFRFRAEVIAFARDSLRGLKGKTARFAYGSVSFRSTAGSREIFDMDAAVAFVGKYAPDKVKVVRTVGVGAVLAAADSYRQATEEEPALASFLASSGPREIATIGTGIIQAKGGES